MSQSLMAQLHAKTEALRKANARIAVLEEQEPFLDDLTIAYALFVSAARRALATFQQLDADGSAVTALKAALQRHESLLGTPRARSFAVRFFMRGVEKAQAETRKTTQ